MHFLQFGLALAVFMLVLLMRWLALEFEGISGAVIRDYRDLV